MVARHRKQRAIDETTTFKDLDLDFVFRLHRIWHRELIKRIEHDCEFFEVENIIDYSLLVNIHFRNDNTMDKMGPSPIVQHGKKASYQNEKHLHGQRFLKEELEDMDRVFDGNVVREARNETDRGGRGSGRGGGRGRGGLRDYPSNDNAFNNFGTAGGPKGDGEGGRDAERRGCGGSRPPYCGGRRGGFNNEEGRDGDRPRRTYERHSGTGRGSEFKSEGSGRGNWGSQSDEVAPGTEEVAVETEKNLNTENLPAGEEVVDGNKEPQPDETEENEAEDKEMTLEEYEKVREEKRKALLALKTEGRKVEVDKDLQSMQQLSSRRDDESVFIKLASDKDKKKDAVDKEKVKKIQPAS